MNNNIIIVECIKYIYFILNTHPRSTHVAHTYHGPYALNEYIRS